MYLIICHYGCGNPATHLTKSGKHICLPHHRSCPAVLAKGYNTNIKKYGGKMPACSAIVLDKMKSTSLKKFGVENASSSHEVKEKRKLLSLLKYGVDNVSKAKEVKLLISEKTKDYWNIIYKFKNFTVQGLTKDEYSRRAMQYANTQYCRFKDIIDPNNLRGKDWHLDHVYSLCHGFINDVPINVISDISNLRLLPATANLKKNASSDKTLERLYEDFQKK